MPGRLTAGINQVSIDEVRRLLTDLPDNGQTRILNRVLNDAASFTEREVGREVSGEVTLSQRDVREFVNVTRSNFSTLSARVTITGAPIPLILFNVNQTQRGLSVRVRREGPREIFPESFIVRLPRQRINEDRTVTRLGGFGREGAFRRRLDRSTGRRVGRLPIDERYGPSIPNVYENNGLTLTLPAVGDRMVQRTGRELDSYFRGF